MGIHLGIQLMNISLALTLALSLCHSPSVSMSLSLSPSIFPSASTASNSNRSTPACSPVLRKRSRSPTPQSPEGENMVEKGSDHSSDKSPSTPEQVVQRTYSLQSARSGGKNSKVRGCFSVHAHRPTPQPALLTDT